MTSKRPCYLRETKIILADGKSRSFRALPFNRSTVKLLENIESPDVSSAESLLAIVAAVEKSLSYDQTEEEIAEIFDTGLIPMEMDSPQMKAIMGALFGKSFVAAPEA